MNDNKKRIVAIASSTGGPRALQQVIPKLPRNLKVPVLIVQHMPKGFTASLASRLDELSFMTVREANHGDILLPGNVYLCQGGVHMNVRVKYGNHAIEYSDEPPREGVKPCANYMYESLVKSKFDEIVCVVLTGMGADGTQGIKALSKGKRIMVIAQNKETSTVYGMPRCIVESGLTDKVVPLENVAQEIITNVGVM